MRLIEQNKIQIVFITVLLLLKSIGFVAQNIEKQERIANDFIREGNVLFQDSKFSDAEVAYKKSVATYPNNPVANYNLGNAMIHQKRYKEAIAQYDYITKAAKSNELKAKSFHNIGNANMGLNDFQKAVDSYKSSLRLNPKDEETRYNLALAQGLLKQQQQQNQDNKDNNDDKNQDNKNQDNKNKEDNDKDEKEEDQDKDKKDEDKKKNEKDDKNEDKPKEDEQNADKDKQENNNQQQPTQPQSGKLSPEQVRQLLEAMQNEENKTQDKMNAKRVKGRKVKTEKDW